jgi:DNA-binding NtrC family response regulator
VRLISATNSDLAAEVAAGRFRQDLLFRLNTIQIHLPPLGSAGGHRPPRPALPEAARRALPEGDHGLRRGGAARCAAYAWPGNVRELNHAIERAVLMAQGKVVRAADLALNASASAPRLDDMSLEEVEAFLIKKTLARCDGNARKAAESLGLSRSAFYRRLEKYGL